MARYTPPTLQVDVKSEKTTKYVSDSSSEQVFDTFNKINDTENLHKNVKLEIEEFEERNEINCSDDDTKLDIQDNKFEFKPLDSATVECCKTQNLTHLEENITIHNQKQYNSIKIKNLEQLQCTKPSQFATTSRPDSSAINKMKWKCAYCGYMTGNKDMLKLHMLNQHNKVELSKPEVKWYNCEHCYYGSVDKNSLDKHALYDHAKKPEWYECEHCDFTTIIKSHLNNHVVNKHKEEVIKKYESEFRALGKWNLEENVKWWECEYCSYKSKYKHSLNAHVLSKHSNKAAEEFVKWHKCGYCEFKAKTKTPVLRHMEKNHRFSLKNCT